MSRDMKNGWTTCHAVLRWKVTRTPSLDFLSNFEGSNGEDFSDPSGGRAERPEEEGPELVHVVLRADPSDGTESTGRRRWFYFGVRSVINSPQKVRFVVNNMSNMLDLYNLDGHRPFLCKLPASPAWRRLADESCNFSCQEEPGPADDTKPVDTRSEQCLKDERLLPKIRTMLDSGPEPPKKRGKSCYIAWDYVLEPGSATTYFAFSPPYTYADLQGYLNRLEQFFAQPETKGKNLPAYMESIEIHGGGSGTLAARTSSPVKPKKVKITIEHGAVDNKKMTLWVRKDSTMLQVRQSIVEVLGLGKLSQVKLVKRMPNSDRLMTPFGDTERLNQRTHLLMVGYEFPDGFKGPEPEVLQAPPEAPEATPEAGPALPMLNGTEESWNPVSGSKIYLHRQRLCLTREGRRVDLLTVSELSESNAKVCVETSPACFLSSSVAVDGESPAELFPQRPIVFVSARVHPGETPGQFAFFGLLRFLLSDDPRAELLRRQFVFKLVPMLNPDGVARGHTRANAGGLDLNRCYGDANPREHEGVFWALEWLKHWASEGRLLFYLDMHAHAHTRGCILYGNRLSGAAQVWNVAFARICELNGPHFDFEGCEFPPMSDKEHGHDSNENCGRASVAAMCNVSHAYTLECHYSIGRQAHPVEELSCLHGRPAHPGMHVPFVCQVPYGVYEWESVGEALACAMLDLHGVTTLSRSSAQALDVLGEVAARLAAPGVKATTPESLLTANPREALRLRLPATLADQELCEVQLWRVLHSVVVARERPDLEAQVLEVFGKGQMLAVAEEVPGSPWVRLATPCGFLGGKLNTELYKVGRTAAYMLTDGSAKGLGQLLQKTNCWMCMRRRDLEMATPGDANSEKKWLQDNGSQDAHPIFVSWDYTGPATLPAGVVKLNSDAALR
ncbi:agbl5 [Symbiodinium microadriaticum]|nr:agbl5 [Symbiodinium microadriaticum]